jgi:hypothetical protein
MTDQSEDKALKASDCAIQDSVASGRISQSEADVMKMFFRTAPQANWPSSDIQKRMQASGG